MNTKILSNLTFYSGGARGADTLWESVLTRLGARFIVYRPHNIDNLQDAELKYVDEAYREVVKLLGRKVLSLESYTGKLVRRDMLQVKDASQVIALAPIDKNTGYVSGGTGYSTTRAIVLGIPVSVFDFNDKIWKQWSYSLNQFKPADHHLFSPVSLEDKSCLVGSRELIPECNDEVIKLIKNYIKEHGKN